MDGILIIDKSEGFTSHDVVARLRRILGTKKIGHTGTLDPFATGVLVMLVGRATRLAEFLDKDEKEYEAVVRFGFETDTGDRTGLRNAECRMQNAEGIERLSTVDWEATLSQFHGEIEQIPPMYSAKKVDGKKLYEHARKGVEIEREPVKISIRELEIIDSAAIRNPQLSIRIRVVCTAGTYIRTLAEDIGRAVGVGAHLQELRRTRAGRFDISQTATLEELKNDTQPEKKLLPIEAAIAHLGEFVLEDDRIEKTKNGLSTRIEKDSFQNGDAIRMTDKDGCLISIGIYDATESCIHPKVVLV